ncbi:hypothetical protein JCM10450v2_007729 [Rhodotorula kratochvilovae]
MHVLSSLVALALIVAVATQAQAVVDQPATRTAKRASLTDITRTPFNIASPAPTPAFVHPPDPVLLTVQQVATLLTATTARTLSQLGQAAVSLVNSAVRLNIDGVLKSVTGLLSGILCGLLPCPSSKVTDARPTLFNLGGKNCLDSKYNATVINSLFYYGGADTTVYLCPNANINLEGPIYMYGTNQTLTTYGLPLDSARATLTITDSDTTCALYIADAGNDGSTISNIIVNGNRPGLGVVSNGLALIEMGGNNANQVIKNVKAYEPRGWSALHVIEGYQNQCDGAVVRDNQVGPSGHAPSGAQQFSRRSGARRARRDTGSYPPGQWADGISVACKNSIVSGNTITDATDGGIVIFGAPGSQIKGNTIITEQRQALGGINAVDYNPYAGSYTGTVVSGNTITAKASLLKVGIATGPSTWNAGLSNAAITYGGSFTDNTFTTGATGYFGYGISVDGHSRATFTGNSFSNVNFGGVFSSSCFTGTPSTQPLLYNSARSTGNTLQSGFVNANYQLAICIGPGPINSTRTL